MNTNAEVVNSSGQKEQLTGEWWVHKNSHYVQYKAFCTVVLNIKTLKIFLAGEQKILNTTTAITVTNICRFWWLLSHWKLGIWCTKCIDYKCLRWRFWMHLRAAVLLDLDCLKVLIVWEEDTESEHILLFLSNAVFGLLFLWLNESKSFKDKDRWERL